MQLLSWAVASLWNDRNQQLISPEIHKRGVIISNELVCLLQTEFLLTGLSKQLAKIHNSSLNTTHSARSLGFIFDEHLTFSDQNSSVSKSCYYHIRQLRCICPYLDTKIASTIATSTVHFKLDYCNSVYHNLPKSQITLLQQIQNSLARALSKPPNPVTSLPSYGFSTG